MSDAYSFACGRIPRRVLSLIMDTPAPVSSSISTGTSSTRTCARNGSLRSDATHTSCTWGSEAGPPSDGEGTTIACTVYDVFPRRFSMNHLFFVLVPFPLTNLCEMRLLRAVMTDCIAMPTICCQASVTTAITRYQCGIVFHKVCSRTLCADGERPRILAGSFNGGNRLLGKVKGELRQF